MTHGALLTELTQLKKPILEPVALEDVVSYIHASQGETAFIRMMMPLWRHTLEEKLGIAFYTQQLRATFQFQMEPMGLIPITWNYENMLCTLPRPPLQSIDIAAVETDIDIFTPVTTKTYDSVKEFPAQIYFYGDAFGMVEYPWWINLNREPRVQVTYTCGYETLDAIPEKYKMLLLQFYADSYIQREGGGISPSIGSSILADKVISL